MSNRRPPRLDPDFYRGFSRIFLTMCTFSRTPYFDSAATVDFVHRDLLRTAAEADVEILAYCYMPDHLHLLVTGQTDQADILKFVQVFRQRAGHAFRQSRRMRLWQEGFFDRILRDEDTTLAVVHYVVANPVRAGLCNDPADFPYSGSSQYSLNELIEPSSGCRRGDARLKPRATDRW